MELSEAIALIQYPRQQRETPETWADLGCGTGLFTRALAQLLPTGSTVYAVDQDKNALEAIPRIPGTHLKKIPADFTADTWEGDHLDGILMANALHYVKDQPAFLQGLRQRMRPTAAFLIVEYDTSIANPWVPYPLSYPALQQLFASQEYPYIQRLGTRPSVYGRALMYAAYISRK